MTTNCHQIDQVIELAIKSGNAVFDLPENKNKEGKLVVWMYDNLTDLLKSEVNKRGLKLRYWHFKGVPHNPEASGYTCDECNVVLAFPNAKTPLKQ